MAALATPQAPPRRSVGLKIGVAAVVVIAAAALRMAFLDYETGDGRIFLSWYSHVASNGGFAALKDISFANYNVTYLYILAGLSYLPVTPLIGIKIVSALFDFLLGYFVYRIVALRYPGKWWPVLAGEITLFLPTVVVNASMWGQADAMYAAFAVGGVYFVLRKRPWLACAFIGVAFAPLCGIQIADYYVVRRRRIDIRAMFDPSPTGAYAFWAGFNPAAIVALAVGCAAYIYLLNPLTYESHGPFRLLTASLPTAFASGVVYVVLTLCLVVPSGRGGYR